MPGLKWAAAIAGALAATLPLQAGGQTFTIRQLTGQCDDLGWHGLRIVPECIGEARGGFSGGRGQGPYLLGVRPGDPPAMGGSGAPGDSPVGGVVSYTDADRNVLGFPPEALRIYFEDGRSLPLDAALPALSAFASSTLGQGRQVVVEEMGSMAGHAIRDQLVLFGLPAERIEVRSGTPSGTLQYVDLFTE
ncbi:MAG: hypothetical protein RLO50_10915 [Azospirillaceae bacterium]